MVKRGWGITLKSLSVAHFKKGHIIKMGAHIYRCEIVKKYIITTIHTVFYLEKTCSLLEGVGTCSPIAFPPAPSLPLCVQITKEIEEKSEERIGEWRDKIQNRLEIKRESP